MMVTKSSIGSSDACSQGKRIIEVEISLRRLDKYFKIATSLGEISVTQRELDCLYCLLLGMPAKLSALQLHISHRTVESHIESIKNKLGCTKKDEIVSVVNYTIIHRNA